MTSSPLPADHHTTAPKVEIFVDPVCPFAWVTSQWLREVAAYRPIELSYSTMSLAILNRNPEDPWELSRGTESAWRQVRVAEAIASELGSEARGDFLQEFGHRYHVMRERGRDEVLRASLKKLDATDLYAAADDHAYDKAVQQSHQRAIDAVAADGVGTPVTCIDGSGTFGPILTSVPRGDEALELFDALIVLLRHSAFSELKRRRESDPIPD